MAPTLNDNDDIVVIHRWHKMAPVISLRNTNYERLEGGMGQNRQNRFAWKEFEVESNNPTTLCPVPCPHATPLPNLISVSMPNCGCANMLAAVHTVSQLVPGRRPGPFQPRSPPYPVPTSTSAAWAVGLYLMNANIPTFTLQIQILFY